MVGIHIFKALMYSLFRSIIVSEAGHKEEGTRNIVAECLGRVAFLQPDELVPRLHQEVRFFDSIFSFVFRSDFSYEKKF